MEHKEFMLNLLQCTETEFDQALAKFETAVRAIEQRHNITNYFIQDVAWDLRKPMLIRKIALVSLFESFLPQLITYKPSFGEKDGFPKFHSDDIHEVYSKLPADIKAFAEKILKLAMESEEFKSAIRSSNPYPNPRGHESRSRGDNYSLSTTQLADHALLAYLEFFSHDPIEDFQALTKDNQDSSLAIALRFLNDNYVRKVGFGLKSKLIKVYAVGENAKAVFSAIGRWDHVKEWFEAGAEHLETFCILLTKLPKESTFKEKDYRELHWVCEALGTAFLHETRRVFLAYWLEGVDVKKVEAFPNIWAGSHHERQSNFRLCRELEALLASKDKQAEIEALHKGMAAKEVWWKDWSGRNTEYKDALLSLIEQ